MKIKVSKVFAKFINDTAKQLGFKCEASVVTMGERGYRLNVGDLFDAEDYGDYDWVTGEYKAIRIVYPSNYYAMARYLTTAQLSREFQRRGVTTPDALREMLRDMCER